MKDRNCSLLNFHRMTLPTAFAVIIGKTFEYNYEYDQYLKQARLIVVLDSTILTFIKHAIPYAPDVLLGDFDNPIDEELIKKHYPDITIIPAPNQDASDFEKGLEYLIGRGHRHIIGLGLTGRRMDHTFHNISVLAKYNDHAHIQLIDNYSIIECISRIYSKVHAKGTQISLLPVGEVQGVITKNLVYRLMNESLALGRRTGSSNEVLVDGEVVVTIGKGKLVVMECWD